MAWQFIATDLNGVPLGELTEADERKVTLPLLRVATCAFKLPLWHDRANDLMNTDCLIRAYRTDPRTPGNRVLAFHGPVVSAEETSGNEGKTIQVNAAGPMWRLTKRLIGTTVAGIQWTNTDLGLIAHNILDTVNGAANGYTGISKGTRTASVNGTYGPVWLKNAAEAIAELHAGLNSFEFIIDPVADTGVTGNGGWPEIGKLRIAPLIGGTKPDAIFEYGTERANVASYTRNVSRDGILTKGWISVQGWPDTPFENKGLLSATGSVATRGLFEEVVSDAGVTDDTMRQRIVDFHRDIRQNPRQIITFRPVTNAKPSPFTDYVIGDTVRARAVVNGSLRFDALFRIWGISFEVDKNGNESVELELITP